MDLLLLNRDEVDALLDPDALLTALADGFIALSAGQVQAPTRSELGAAGTGHLLVKPAWIDGQPMAVREKGPLFVMYPSSTTFLEDL